MCLRVRVRVRSRAGEVRLQLAVLQGDADVQQSWKEGELLSDLRLQSSLPGRWDGLPLGERRIVVPLVGAPCWR